MKKVGRQQNERGFIVKCGEAPFEGGGLWQGRGCL